MKDKTLVLIDFDGTIFKTGLFNSKLFDFLSDKLNIDYSYLEETYELSKSKAGSYDLFKHLKLLKVKKTLFDEIRNEIITSFSQIDLVFDDAKRFVSKAKGAAQTISMICTIGVPNFQNIKFKIAGLDDSINKIVTDKQKVEFLKINILRQGNAYYFLPDQTLYDNVVVIDDNPVSFSEEIEGLDMIRIRRDGEKYSDLLTPSYAKEIILLDEVLDLLV